MSDPVNRPPIEDTVFADDAPPPSAAGDARTARAEAFQRRRERESAELAAVINTEGGQALVMRILAHCQPYRSTLLSNEVTQYAKAEGRREVALWLIDELGRLGPEVYPRLLLAHAARAQKQADVDTVVAKNVARTKP